MYENLFYTCGQLFIDLLTVGRLSEAINLYDILEEMSHDVLDLGVKMQRKFYYGLYLWMSGNTKESHNQLSKVQRFYQYLGKDYIYNCNKTSLNKLGIKL